MIKVKQYQKKYWTAQANRIKLKKKKMEEKNTTLHFHYPGITEQTRANLEER